MPVEYMIIQYDIEGNYGTETSKFIKTYYMLLDEIKEALPNVKLILIAPFVLEGKSTKNTDTDYDRFSKFKCGTDEKIAAVKGIAKKYGLPVIDLQAAFDKKCETVSPLHFSLDGVHPTPEGHEIIKRLWIEEFEKIDRIGG